MDSIKGTLSSVTGATSAQTGNEGNTPSTMDAIKGSTVSAMNTVKGTISSVTGTGSNQTDNDSSKDALPSPPETGLQSRGQTEHSGSGSFLGQMKDMVNAAAGRGGTKEEKELALEKGQEQQTDGTDVGQAKPEQIEEFIRDKYHSQADGKLRNKD